MQGVRGHRDDREADFRIDGAGHGFDKRVQLGDVLKREVLADIWLTPCCKLLKNHKKPNPPEPTEMKIPMGTQFKNPKIIPRTCK
jgi:hypothetical protein